MKSASRHDGTPRPRLGDESHAHEQREPSVPISDHRKSLFLLARLMVRAEETIGLHEDNVRALRAQCNSLERTIAAIEAEPEQAPQEKAPPRDELHLHAARMSAAFAEFEQLMKVHLTGKALWAETTDAFGALQAVHAPLAALLNPPAAAPDPTKDAEKPPPSGDQA